MHNYLHFMQMALVVAGVAASAPAAAGDEKTFHRAFDRVAHKETNADRTVLLDGKPVPDRFSIPLDGRPGGERSEPLKFVLIDPGEAELDGLAFEAKRPFYMATTSLSNGQKAALGGRRADGYASYEVFAENTYARARFDFWVSGANLERLEKHLSDPKLPAVLMDVGTATRCTRHLAAKSRLAVRLPTIGEWLVAMRGGADSAYWMGDEPPWDEIAWGDAWRTTHPFEQLKQVDDGASHPYGLFHIIGNVADLAFPSDVERELLRRHYGPQAVDAREARHLGLGLIPRPHGGIRLGGCVATLASDLTEESGRGAQEKFLFLTSLWWSLLAFGQVDTLTGWGYEQGWATGARFVVELPPGEVTIETPGPDEPRGEEEAVSRNGRE